MRAALALVWTSAGVALSLSSPALGQGYLPQQPQQQQEQQQQVAPAPPPNAPPPTEEYLSPADRRRQRREREREEEARLGPKVINDYSDGDPIPPGYHPQGKVSWGLIGAGGGLVLVPWVVSAITAGLEVAFCNGCKEVLWPLVIPVAGPFVTLGTAGTDSVAGDFVLVVDGLAQVAGLAMIIAGVVPHTVLVRNDVGAPLLQLKPMFGMGQTRTGHGMGITLDF